MTLPAQLEHVQHVVEHARSRVAGGALRCSVAPHAHLGMSACPGDGAISCDNRTRRAERGVASETATHGHRPTTVARPQEGVINDLVLLSIVGIQPVLVHGGGPEINIWLNKLGIEAEFKNGLRVTDGELRASATSMPWWAGTHRPNARPWPASSLEERSFQNKHCKKAEHIARHGLRTLCCCVGRIASPTAPVVLSGAGETMDVVEMVLTGRVNKSLVTLIQQAGGRAVGLCGKDSAMLDARQMVEKVPLDRCMPA